MFLHWIKKKSVFNHANFILLNEQFWKLIFKQSLLFVDFLFFVLLSFFCLHLHIILKISMQTMATFQCLFICLFFIFFLPHSNLIQIWLFILYDSILKAFSIVDFINTVKLTLTEFWHPTKIIKKKNEREGDMNAKMR